VSKRIFQVVFLVFAIFGWYLAYTKITFLDAAGRFPPGIVRLKILELRGGGSPANAVLASADLLDNGCLSIFPQQPVLHNGSFILGSSPANGYSFVSGSNAWEDDPIRWTVEVSGDNGSTWLPVGASVWRLLSSDGSLDLHRELPYGTSFPGTGNMRSQLRSDVGITEKEIRVDARPPLSFVLTSFAQSIYFSVGFFSFSVLGIIGRADWMRAAWLTVLALDGVFYASGVATIAFAEPFLWREGIMLGFYVLALGVLVAGSAFYERKLIRVILMCSIFTMGINTGCELNLYQRDLLAVLLQQMASIQFLGFVFCTAAIVFRKRASARAYALVMADRVEYDAVWVGLKSDTVVQAALHFVKDTASKMIDRSGKQARQQAIQGAANHQINSAQNQFATLLPASVSRWLNRVDSSNTVQSLDQLYVQAWCLYPVLRVKVQKWALKSNGCFPVNALNGDLTFIPFAQMEHDESLGAIRWPHVKSTSRAIEKLVRAYNQVVWPVILLRVLDKDFFSLALMKSDMLFCLLLGLLSTAGPVPTMHHLRESRRDR
jgi:hypothetical protein